MICAECAYLDEDDIMNGKHLCSYYRTYVWPSDEACSRFREDRYRSTRDIERLTSSNSGACIITMSCKKALGVLFSDKCDELETIRSARELFRSEKQGEITEYYQKSPAVVSGINNSPNKDELFLNIYRRMTQPLVDCIKRGDLKNGYDIYRNVTNELFNRYCLDE